MRTTVDIPDAIYRELKSEAALAGKSVKELILTRVTQRKDLPSKRPVQRKFPKVRSEHPGSLKLGPEGVYEYIPFP